MEDSKAFNDSVMIALLPTTTDWCKIELPHMTLVFAGKKQDHEDGTYNEIAKDAASIAMVSSRLTCEVIERTTMGGNWKPDEPQCDVYRLRASDELLAMRNFVERWNASEWPFNPHVTIGSVGTPVEYPPKYITFDRIGVFWGNESLKFRLKP